MSSSEVSDQPRQSFGHLESWTSPRRHGAIALRPPSRYALPPEGGQFVMEQAAEEIYRSSNGDRWTLIRDTNSGRRLVRHEANPSSGGQVTETDVEAFLSIGGSGPEFAALRRLLDGPADPAVPLQPTDGETSDKWRRPMAVIKV